MNKPPPANIMEAVKNLADKGLSITDIAAQLKEEPSTPPPLDTKKSPKFPITLGHGLDYIEV